MSFGTPARRTKAERPFFALYRYTSTQMSPVILRSYWTEVHQIFIQCSPVILLLAYALDGDILILCGTPVRRTKVVLIDVRFL